MYVFTGSDTGNLDLVLELIGNETFFDAVEAIFPCEFQWINDSNQKFNAFAVTYSDFIIPWWHHAAGFNLRRKCLSQLASN